MKLLNVLRKRAGVRSLLSDINSNPKVAKNNKLGVLTAALHLAPGNMSDHEVCPKRSPGCSAACLHFSGSPAYLATKTQSRIKKTRLFFSDRQLFMNILALEIAKHLKLAEKLEMTPAVRLNATSDIVWETKHFRPYPEVAELLGIGLGKISQVSLFPTTSFYDYTAIPNRNPPENYHLTFSEKEQNMNDVLAEMSRGRNIAAVFYDELPEFHLGRKVVNGDEHDYRPADPAGCVVGLKAKGLRGKTDASGFVKRPMEDLLLAA